MTHIKTMKYNMEYNGPNIKCLPKSIPLKYYVLNLYLPTLISFKYL